MSVEPEIPKDSSYLYDKMLTTLKEDLKKGIGYVAAKGEMVWGWKDSKIAQTHSCKFTSKTIAYSFTVLLKPIKEILLKDFLNESPDKIAAVCQILNINTKNILKEKLKMT